YRAGQAGVQIDLVCRGICSLRPGLPGISDNIRVRSIVDRFLEHSRVFYFGNGGDPQVYIGSADWMDRNLSRRVEVVFPIEQADLKKRLIDEVLAASLADSAKARELLSDGSYRRVSRSADQPALRSQERFLEIAAQNAQRRLIEATPQPPPVLAPQKARRRRRRGPWAEEESGDGNERDDQNRKKEEASADRHADRHREDDEGGVARVLDNRAEADDRQRSDQAESPRSVVADDQRYGRDQDG